MLLTIPMMTILIGNKSKERGDICSPLFFFCCRLLVLALLIPALATSAQTTITAKVARNNPAGKYYGKVNLPKGNKYYVDFHPAEGVTTGVYSAYIDGENIFLQSVGLVEGKYMIDASDRDMAFIVRSSSSDDIVVKVVDQDLSDWMDENDYFYYDAIDARRNTLIYATAAVSNATLMSTYPTKRIYVMANPAKNDLAFAVLDHQNTGRGLAANSLYLPSRKKYTAARLNIVWVDEPDSDDAGVTAIASVNTSKAQADGAVYTLQGVRVAAPVKGGLYIRNGKKYIAQ